MRYWGYLTGILLLCGAQASAQSAAGSSDQIPRENDDIARGLFQAGKAAYEAGAYRDALSYFEQAYERCGRSALLYNVGQAADRLRQDDKAIDSFTKYTEQNPDAPNRAEVEKRIQALREARQARQQEERQTKTESASDPSPMIAALTPEQTAESAAIAPARQKARLAPSKPLERVSTSEPVTQRGWFWAAVGVVVVGGTLTALALALGGTK
jgi:tetratricopeptide (TPR) repeat protein